MLKLTISPHSPSRAYHPSHPPHHPPTGAPDTQCRPSSAAPSASAENAAFVLNFPCVCPEPVLVNRSLLVPVSGIAMECYQNGAFRTASSSSVRFSFGIVTGYVTWSASEPRNMWIRCGTTKTSFNPGSVEPLGEGTETLPVECGQSPEITRTSEVFPVRTKQVSLRSPLVVSVLVKIST